MADDTRSLYNVGGSAVDSDHYQSSRPHEVLRSEQEPRECESSPELRIDLGPSSMSHVSQRREGPPASGPLRALISRRETIFERGEFLLNS
jgi:hypothetical protein